MPSRFRSRRGFTIVELLVVLAILTILGTAAVPKMNRALTLIRSRSVLDQVASGLFQARMLAVRDGRTAEMRLEADENGCIGRYSIARRDEVEAVKIVDLRAETRHLCLVHSRSPATPVVRFNSRGMVLGGNSTFSFTRTDVPGRLVLSIAGRVQRHY